MLTLLYSDPNFTIINKPNGLLVHRTSIAEDDDVVALQLLRDQLGHPVFPVHRLDRPTSGIVLFGHNSEITRALQEELAQNHCQKQYTALVRGWIHEAVSNTREVKNDRGTLKEAETHFKPLQQFELPIATDRYATARFSIIEAYPLTGRWHQIRQHLGQMRHYIINDRVHGDGKQNRLFTEQLGIREMFLHAHRFTITHPVSGEKLHIEAPLPEHWNKIEKMIAETRQ